MVRPLDGGLVSGGHLGGSRLATRVGFILSIDIDLVFVWAVDTDLISVWGIELRLISV